MVSMAILTGVFGGCRSSAMRPTGITDAALPSTDGMASDHGTMPSAEVASPTPDDGVRSDDALSSVHDAASTRDDAAPVDDVAATADGLSATTDDAAPAVDTPAPVDVEASDDGGCSGRFLPIAGALLSLQEAQSEKPTATLLSGGKVLVTGGKTWASAGLYDPSAGTFEPTGSLQQGRYDPTATLLPTGMVLILGGGMNTEGVMLSNTAEVYDPSVGELAKTGNPIEGREGHTATVLRDGKVLVVGGSILRNTTTAELYDPSTGLFTATGKTSEARSDHTATLLADGRVLIAGGARYVNVTVDGGSAVQSVWVYPLAAELYDPATGRFTSTGSLGAGRRFHTATPLQNGQVLIVGGQSPEQHDPSLEAELYDPSLGQFKPAGAPSASRFGHTATLLNNGKVLIAGGRDVGDSSTNPQLATAELYDPATGEFIPTGSLSTPRADHTATLLENGQVLVMGGTSALQPALAELYCY